MYHILLAVLMAALLAKRGRRGRWNPNNKVVRVSGAIALLTLADVTLLAGSITNVSDEAYRVFSVKATYALRDFTQGEGPLEVGIAHGDYTDAEIEEWREATAAISRGDEIAREQMNRKCRHVGTFGLDSGGDASVLNDGRPIKTRLNWVIATGDTVKVWIYNRSGGPLTSGSEVVVAGSAFIRFV